MLYRLLARFAPLLYVQIEPLSLRIRNVRTGAYQSEAAEIALTQRDGHKLVLGAGNDAATYRSHENATLLRPFAHPRTLVSDFQAGEALLRDQIKKALGRPIVLAPRIVMHPMGTPEGGFTEIEVRALREMALGAGACEVRVWTGRALSDDQLRTDQETHAGGRWM